MSPTRSVPNAAMPEMSSVVTSAPWPGRSNGCPHDKSSPSVRFTLTLPPSTHVTQRRPLESFAMTRASDLEALTFTGKPGSRLYDRVPAW